MNYIYNYAQVIVLAVFIMFASSAFAFDAREVGDQAAASQLTDYCSRFSKAYVENYLTNSDAGTHLSDNQKYELLGEVFNNCLHEKNSELKNNVRYNFQNEFYLY
jgi:hypothetical protein